MDGTELFMRECELAVQQTREMQRLEDREPLRNDGLLAELMATKVERKGGSGEHRVAYRGLYEMEERS